MAAASAERDVRTMKAAARGEELADIFGVKDPRTVRFADDILSALRKVAPELVPTKYEHPLEELIFKGPASFPQLIDMIESAPDEISRAAAVDAVAEIIRLGRADEVVVAALYRILQTSESSLIVSIACRALAVARDEAFLADQRRQLGASSASRVRTAAKLLGFGRDTKAVPVLLSLLRPDNLVVADAVIWALGEIGDPTALPLLHGMLAAFAYSEQVVEAVGKIGHQISIPRVLAALHIEGQVALRERAAQALVRILKKNDGQIDLESLACSCRDTLGRVIRNDHERVVRFYAVVAASILGTRMSVGELRLALCTELTRQEADAMSHLFARRAGH